MKENSIIFLDLNNMYLFTSVHFDNSRITDLTSALRIEWCGIEYQHSLSLHFKILEQFHTISR